MDTANYGQNIISTLNGERVKVHHVDSEGRVFYFIYAFADLSGGSIVHDLSWNHYNGFIRDYRPATKEESLEFERWIIRERTR